MIPDGDLVLTLVYSAREPLFMLVLRAAWVACTSVQQEVPPIEFLCRKRHFVYYSYVQKVKPGQQTHVLGLKTPQLPVMCMLYLFLTNLMCREPGTSSKTLGPTCACGSHIPVRRTWYKRLGTHYLSGYTLPGVR